MPSPEAMIKQINSKIRIGSLDGLRAIAIILVLLYHLTPSHNSDQGFKSIAFKIADIGWSGVDLFFVLSGYLITSILVSNKVHGRPLYVYFVRRFLRIIPLYYLVLFLIFFIIPLTINSYEAPGIQTQLPYWLYFSNYYDPFSNVPTSHFWSLAVEVQFYMLWPFVIYNCTFQVVRRLAVLLLIVALFGRAFLVFQGAEWIVTYMWLPWRLDGLVIGSLVAIYLSHGHFSDEPKWALPLFFILGASVFLVAWYGLATTVFKTPYNLQSFLLRIFLPLLVSLFYGLTLILAIKFRYSFLKILEWNLWKPVALYSYGIYIIHFLLLPLFHRYLDPSLLFPSLTGTDFPVYIYFITASSVSYIIAMASYHLFEIRFLNLKSKY